MNANSNPEQLRDLIREAVVEVLGRRSGSAPPSTGRFLIALFTGDEEPQTGFLSQQAELAKTGWQFQVAFSRTFEQFHDTEALMSRFPAGTRRLPMEDEPAIKETVRGAGAVVLPCISENTAAKLALGLQDSGPSMLLARAVAAGKPVFVGCDVPAHRDSFGRQHPAAPPARGRVLADHLHLLQQLGLRFVSGSIAEAVQAEFTPEVNETPERLAKQRPSQKRQFITAEDVSDAISRGQKELVYPRNAVVTDQAREYAAAREFKLRMD